MVVPKDIFPPPQGAPAQPLERLFGAPQAPGSEAVEGIARERAAAEADRAVASGRGSMERMFSEQRAQRPAGEDREAKIKNLDKGEEVICTFRPKELTFSKQNTWSTSPVKGKNVGKVEFGGGGNARLQVELLFDTSKQGSDVRVETMKLWGMMLIDEKNPKTRDPKTGKSRPPTVQFEWGNLSSFIGVIESISQKFVLFKPNGTPVRAILNVSFQQFGDDQYTCQNPTSGGSAGYKVRVVREGETLDLLAFEEYGDPARWRLLAEANGLDDPLRLRPGQALAVPPLW